MAELGPARPEVGQGAGRGRRLRPQRLGAGRCKSTELPNYEMPKFDGIGANEYVVDVGPRRLRLHLRGRHAVGLGAEHLVPHAELRLPHAASAAKPTSRASTASASVSAGLCEAATGKLDYDQWVYGVRDGRNYVGDGLSHLFDFTVGGLASARRASGVPASWPPRRAQA